MLMSKSIHDNADISRNALSLEEEIRIFFANCLDIYMAILAHHLGESFTQSIYRISHNFCMLQLSLLLCVF